MWLSRKRGRGVCVTLTRNDLLHLPCHVNPNNTSPNQPHLIHLPLEPPHLGHPYIPQRTAPHDQVVRGAPRYAQRIAPLPLRPRGRRAAGGGGRDLVQCGEPGVGGDVEDEGLAGGAPGADGRNLRGEGGGREGA